jgi:rubrerythrin
MISPMESLDQQFRQQKENYERMTEGELAAIAERAYDLTEIAREALQAVIMEKGVDIRIKMEPLALPPEDEDLVIFGWPRGAEAAGQSMKILAAAGIPSFLTLEVRPDDVNRAHAALERAYEEMAKEENAKDDLEKTEYAILCPQCHSTKVILKGRTSTLEANPFGIKYKWICDACGHQWVDDGITQEAAGGQSWSGEEFSSRRGPFRRVDPKWASEP